MIEGTAQPVALPAPAPTDEQLDATLDALREITRGARQRGGENVIKGTAEPVAPKAQSPEATPEPKHVLYSDSTLSESRGEYLTPKEVDRLQDAARKHSRYGTATRRRS